MFSMLFQSQYRFVCECICAAYMQQAAKEQEASVPNSPTETRKAASKTTPTTGSPSNAAAPKPVPSIASPEETMLDTPADSERKAPLATETTSISTATVSPSNGHETVA